MNTEQIDFIDLADAFIRRGAPSKITINETDLNVLKSLFLSFFEDAGIYDYWSSNKLGLLNQVPVHSGINAKHSATLYW